MGCSKQGAQRACNYHIFRGQCLPCWANSEDMDTIPAVTVSHRREHCMQQWGTVHWVCWTFCNCRASLSFLCTEVCGTHTVQLPSKLDLMWCPKLRYLGCPAKTQPGWALSPDPACLSAPYSSAQIPRTRSKRTLLVGISSSWDQGADSREGDAGHGGHGSSCPHHPAKQHCSHCSGLQLWQLHPHPSDKA